MSSVCLCNYLLTTLSHFVHVLIAVCSSQITVSGLVSVCCRDRPLTWKAITLLVGSSTCKIVSEMTCNVSSGTLNTIIPYHTILQTLLTASPSTFISTAFVNYYHCSAFTIKIGMGQDIHHLLWNSIYSLLDWYTVQFESR